MKALLFALCCAAAAPAGAVSHVFLVQNSGWMEPFYSDPASQYKALVREVALAAVQPGDALVMASFNQSLPGAPSPRALLALKVDAKPPRDAIANALASLAVARKPGSSALADTDLGEAVRASMDVALGGKPGLVWLFTNNRNSPNNDQATARRNREFYQLIHEGGAIRKALAFPLHMPVHGASYSANGLMVYVFAVQEEGARELDRLMASGRVQQVITEPPARLKPLDQDTVRLLPAKVENLPGVAFSTLPNGLLRADIDADTGAAQGASARIAWRMENAIYPYTIAHARIAARADIAGSEAPIRLEHGAITALSPGKPQAMASAMPLPLGELPGKWSLQALRSAGSAQVLPARIEVQLADQKLELSQAFRQRMAALFPGDPLPEIFTPPAQIQGSRATLPLEVRVHYGMAPLAMAAGAALALLGAAAAATVAMTRPRKVLLTIDGEPRTVRAKPGARTPLYDRTGMQAATLHTTVFGNQLADVREGAQVRLGK
ncbi:hypothetical protein [Massilia endophytica]|uniref:hypothetical protein n=1 Tax=Massilia endophytica TaxID=2899220 RepID=UPI001E479FF8|nr:hypothetical protein [Massilia endophytica]UGQ45397.1 hypothetical protein LSQ66_16590 [Massilia endophytica]